jgi:hypothetical protein
MALPRTARSIALPFVLALLPASAGAESWDPQRVVGLATQLEEAIGLGLESAEAAGQQRTAMQQRTRDAALIEMKRAHAYSREYASKLRGGWSRDDSAPFFDQLRRATRRARETARDAVPDPAVAPHLERMDALLLELSGMYEED